MRSDFLPRREADLIAFATNMSAKVTAAPTVYSLTAAQATTLAGLLSAFVTKYNIVNDPLTRSPGNIALKNVAKATLVANLRLLAGIVQAAPATTNPMRIELGLTPRHTEPTPIPAPSMSPLIQIKETFNRTVRIRLIDAASPTRRGLPPGVNGISVFSHVGEAAPTELSAWKFEGNSGRTLVDIVFPGTVASGATVWLTAFYFNPRKQSGDACAPVSTHLPGGGVSTIAA